MVDTIVQLMSSDFSELENAPGKGYEALKELADCYAAAGNNLRAREFYRKATASAPDATDAYVGLGVVAIKLGQLDEAKDAFKTAFAKDPTCVEACSGLAMIYQSQDDYPTAFEMYLKCLEADADNLIALLGLFQTSCQMGTFSRVIHYLQVYLESHPKDASVLFCLATLYAREGELQKARKCLVKVLAIEPNKVEAFQLLAEIQKKHAAFEPGADGQA